MAREPQDDDKPTDPIEFVGRIAAIFAATVLLFILYTVGRQAWAMHKRRGLTEIWSKTWNRSKNNQRNPELDRLDVHDDEEEEEDEDEDRKLAGSDHRRLLTRRALHHDDHDDQDGDEIEERYRDSISTAATTPILGSGSPWLEQKPLPQRPDGGQACRAGVNWGKKLPDKPLPPVPGDGT